MNDVKLKPQTVIFIILAIFLSIVSYKYLTDKSSKESAALRVTALSIPTPISTVIFVPVRVESPDGTRTLTMKKQKNNTTATYSFFASKKPGNQEKLIAAKIVSSSHSFSIPDNTWSPDNKYAFVMERTPSQKSYFVLPASDSLPQSDLQNTDVYVLFSQKYSQYILTDITGWAAPNLLIMNTNNETGERGPSFWFDITTQSFIQLSSNF